MLCCADRCISPLPFHTSRLPLRRPLSFLARNHAVAPQVVKTAAGNELRRFVLSGGGSGGRESPVNSHTHCHTFGMFRIDLERSRTGFHGSLQGAPRRARRARRARRRRWDGLRPARSSQGECAKTAAPQGKVGFLVLKQCLSSALSLQQLSVLCLSMSFHDADCAGFSAFRSLAKAVATLPFTPHFTAVHRLSPPCIAFHRGSAVATAALCPASCRWTTMPVLFGTARIKRPSRGRGTKWWRRRGAAAARAAPQARRIRWWWSWCVPPDPPNRHASLGVTELVR